MGAAQRNPSILFEAAYVPLGFLRVFASPRERLSFRDSGSHNTVFIAGGFEFWFARLGWDMRRSEHVAGVFNDRVQTPACACHARRWWRGPQPGHGEMAALFIIAATTVPPFGIPALFRSVSQPVMRLICGGSG
jgi:hypothetical protein